MPGHLLQEEMNSSCTTTTTIMSPHSEAMQKGREKLKTVPLYLEEDIRPEMKEDIYDPSYQDEEGPPPKLQYVWRNIILMTLLHLGALYGLVLIPSSKFYTLLWAYIYYVVSITGIGAGAHRLWSHRTYKARLPLRVFLIIANTMAFQNDVYEWARDHRAHHKFTETHADPHNSRCGFFFSHVGWLLVRKYLAVKEKGGNWTCLTQKPRSWSCSRGGDERRQRQRPTLEHRTEISRSKSGAEGERARARNLGPRGVHPYTETRGMFYWELTKASWPGSEKAWDKTSLTEHSGQ
ncbi:acyl-CoA desaturase 3 isoform X2 [Alexandromys fortis]|uniref:acyl-CoA desaturase 3 isoform X2 n=1 Tax=Alexandromys fortis TaxID=100897 RepID=UPI002152DDDB|nr:acyl-CoA desaturase 3 isoform X2 [Microtus fortis]